MNDAGQMMKDDDYKQLRGFDNRQMDRHLLSRLKNVFIFILFEFP